MNINVRPMAKAERANDNFADARLPHMRQRKNGQLYAR